MSIKSGRYIIINVQHRNSAFLPDPNDGTFLVGSHEHSIVGDEWNVNEFPNGGYSIANFVHKLSASAEYRPPKGANVEGRKRDRIWRIKQHGSGGKYTIATTNDELRWCLEDGWPETPITLHDAPPSDTRCQWIFQKIVPVDIAAQEVAKVEAAVVRAELEASREELAQANEVAAENVTRRKEAEVEASRKAAEAEDSKRKTIKAKEEAVKTLEELEVARREVALAKEEVESHKSSFRSYFSMISQLDYTITNVLDNKQPQPIQVSLLWAAEMGHGAVAQLILEQDGVDINSKNSRGCTAVQLAAQNGHEAMVRLLLMQEGVNVNSRDETRMTALSLAASKGHDVVVRLLLAKDGVDVNSKNSRGWTALSLAAHNGHDAVVRLLREKMEQMGNVT